jgi:putative salt-induced outer membrane protein YdiY
VGVKDSLYVLAGALIDPFAGYDLRSHEQLGYSRKLVATETTTLTGEVGLDLAQENFVDGVDPGRADVLSGRVMMGFEHAFSESVAFSEQVEVYENLLVPADVRVLNTAALSSKLSNTLSTRLSHTLTFDNVPVEGFRPLDQTTMFTLVASIL